MWTTEEAIQLCKKIEVFAPQHGCHVALTGGLLYKEGPRKDCDIVFYRIRQVEQIDVEKLLYDLKIYVGIEVTFASGWYRRCKYKNKRVDLFFPEIPNGQYTES
jgi:hypothetical protein